MASTSSTVQGSTSSFNLFLLDLIPCWPFHSHIWNAFLFCTSLFSYHKVIPFSLVSFHIGSSHSTFTLCLPCIPATLLSHKCLGCLLLSTLIRCPNQLSSLLSTISVTGTSFSIPQIWLFLFYLFLFVCSTSSLCQQFYFHILLIMSKFMSYRAALGQKPFHKLPF